VPHAHPRAIVSKDVQLFDVVDGVPTHQRVDSARVVPNHAAERAVVVRRRIGCEREVMSLGGVPQVIEDDARLHHRPLGINVQLDDVVHVLRHVDHDGHVAALAGQAGPAATRHDRRTERSTGRDRLRDVLGVAGDHDANRHLPVV
jgi:hypothetical protein